MTKDQDDAYNAGRLLQWGLDSKARPAQEPEYQELINLYLDRPGFREVVQRVAQGLGLVILDAGEHGIIIGPSDGSVFSLRPADFRPTSASVDDRLLDGLIQLAIAATIFPRARDLDDDAAVARPPTSIDEVEDTLRRLCERMDEEHKGEPDPIISDDNTGLYEAWRVYQKYLPVMETRDSRRAQRTTRRFIEYGLDRLRDFGCFTREEQGDSVLYQPTYKYQLLVKEVAAAKAFQAVQDLLNTDQKQLGNGGTE